MRLNQRKLQIRSATAHAESGWAVSYADFLMVLLSFFIVFFSFDEKSALHSIVLSLTQQKSGESTLANFGPGNGHGVSDGGKAAIGNVGAGTGGGVALEVPLLSSVLTKLKDAKIQTANTRERIIVDLPNNIYHLGAFKVPVESMNNILETLKPYQDQVSITIMGHADSAIIQNSQKVVKDNLTLASLRAAYASTYVQQVLTKAQVWIQASENSERKTRSLTFVIELRKGESL